MAEYTATCRLSSYDTMKANIDGGDVEIEALRSGANVMEVFLRPAEARTFARGILALADELDGGEAETKAPTPELPQIGSRFRVTTGGLNSASVSPGDVVTVNVHHTDFFGAMTSGGTTWFFNPANIGKGLEPLVDESSVPATVTAKWGAIKPGDKVRILVNDAECADVEAGDTFTVHAVDERLVTVNDEKNGGHWYFRDTTSIELVDDPDTTSSDEPAPSRSPRAKYVDEARELLRGTPYDATDLTRLAEFLAAGE
ncbi:hypothetical protein [Streptomyces sp. NPDC004528]|uniref:hypothetical protein n=1 Tax=Streptomyces sp. NPDC004528 TaxID=3154550 RepID=UPI0033A3AFED